METFFVFLDESRCYRQKRDLTADFRFKVFDETEIDEALAYAEQS